MAESHDISAVNPDNDAKPSASAFAKARASRPDICGSHAPERPYPIYLRGVVERGFGRGGKELGCPTANLPSKVLMSQPHLNRTGIYFGFARILPQDPDDPELAEAGEEVPEEATGPGSQRSREGSSSSAADNRIVSGNLQPGQHDDDDDYDYDDPPDEEWEVDEDEVIFGASPTGGSEETHRDGADGKLSYAELSKMKPRQMSRSSGRSIRSVTTLLEKANAISLERSQSTQSSQSQSKPGSDVNADSANSSTAPSNSNSALDLKKLGAQAGGMPAPDSSLTNSNDTASSSASTTTDSLANKSTSVKAARLDSDSSPSLRSGDTHDRDYSSSSAASTLRRRKKRRIPITNMDQKVHPMVMSVGWNPFYKNTQKTAEVHIMHDFASDFYGLEMRVVVLGYIRPEYNYVSKDALVEDIEMDKRVAIKSLARHLYQDYSFDPFLLAPS